MEIEYLQNNLHEAQDKVYKNLCKMKFDYIKPHIDKSMQELAKDLFRCTDEDL